MAQVDPQLEALLPEIYEELRTIARHLHSRHRAGDSIRPTSMVHEAYLRLVRTDPDLNDSRHAAAIAARAMRNVLVDRVRRASADRRGGGWERITLTGLGMPETTVDLLALDEALTALAELYGVTRRTIDRDWRAARAWLSEALQ